MRPFQLRSKSFFIAFTFLVFLISHMYPHTERKSHVPQQHKSLTPSKKHFVKKAGSAQASVNDPTAKNSSIDIEFQNAMSKIMVARARILLAGQRLKIYRLKLFYAMLLRIQKEKFQIEEDLRDQNGPENPMDRDIHAWVEGVSLLTKNRGDKGLIYHS